MHPGDWIIAILCALLIGYGIGRYRRSKHRDRCPATTQCLLTWENSEDETTVIRCNHDTGHTGPHGAWWRSKYRWWWGTSEPQEPEAP